MKTIACFVASLLFTSPVLASETGPCELHVWSSQKNKAIVMGWGAALGGGALAGVIDSKLPPDKMIQSILEKAVAAPFQAESLSQLDLPAMFALPSIKIVPEMPLPSPSDWKSTDKRLVNNGASCYAELIVRDMYFLKTAMFKPELRVNFTYRFFGDKLQKPDVMEGRGGNDMAVYPLVSTQDLDKIISDFRRTYLLDFVEFVNEQHKVGRIKGVMPVTPASVSSVASSS